MIEQQDSTLSEVSWQLVIIPQELTRDDLTMTMIWKFDLQAGAQPLVLTMDP